MPCSMPGAAVGVVSRAAPGSLATFTVNHPATMWWCVALTEPLSPLALLTCAVRAGEPLKVVLMSATINADLFSTYFGGVCLLFFPMRNVTAIRRAERAGANGLVCPCSPCKPLSLLCGDRVLTRHALRTRANASRVSRWRTGGRVPGPRDPRSLAPGRG